MNGEHEPPARTASGEPHRDARVPGRWLLLARAGCLAVAGLDLALFIGGLPAYFAEIDRCYRTAVCDTTQVSLNAMQNLHALGLSLDFQVWFTLALHGLFLLVFAVVGLVLFWRKAADPTALVAAFAFLTFPIFLTNVTTALPAFWWLLAQVVNWLGLSALSLLLYLFPDGRFVPRWTRWLWAIPVMIDGAHVFWPSAPFQRLPGTVSFAILVVSVVAVQLYRYVRVSTPVARQQTKWVVIGFTVGLPAALVATALTRSFPGPFRGDLQLYWIVFAVLYLSPLLIPLSIGLAILRYRLWEVDVLINKALVYGGLSGILGALYVGLILGLESLAGAMTGATGQQPVALVVSTLAIAALFQPVRQRMQHVIDRRFYRKKYDAEKTLAAFSATLRHEVDLEELHAQVLAVVKETMQPAHVSLWLRPLEAPQRRQNRAEGGHP
jgi:hypothetical protein